MGKGFLQKILAFSISSRQESLAKTRPPMSKLQFIDEIYKNGGDREAASLIHDYLLEWIYAKGFTPYPNDSLIKIFGIAEEELDEDLILMIFNNLNIIPPKLDEIFPHGPVDTPLRVAQLVNRTRFNR